jgi:gamma-glutamyltranspeptidase/glutathione hydrolase
MVVTANIQASRAAAKILEEGGTAIDGMIAAQLVLGLVEPESSGLGGGAFLLYYDNSSKKITSLDGRETAPLKVKPSMFLSKDGSPLKFSDAVLGGKSVGVPGTPALLEKAYSKWGKLKWSSLFEEATSLSNNGFIVSKKLSSSIERNYDSISKIKRTRDYFIPDGVKIKAGQVHRNKAYANTLNKFSKYGANIFYSGEIADDIVFTVNNSSTIEFLSKKDLLLYEIKEKNPVCSSYRGYQICGMGPPSSGAVTINQILGIVENFPLSQLGSTNPETWRIIGEASRLAFADRSLYMADDDFIDVPVEGLLSKEYLKDRSRLLNGKYKIPIVRPGIPETKTAFNYHPDMSRELPSTSHMSIVDKYGNILSMTSTIESSFGSNLMTKSGFLLNNELTDFSFISHSGGKLVANRIEPGKRPRSSMSPTIIFKENKPIYIIGSPGGSNIIGFVLNAIIGLLDWDMNVQEAASIPHAINKFGDFDIEANTRRINMKQSLEEMGYKVNLKEFFSGLNIIEVKDKIYGGSDPRREGVAIGG